MGVLDENGGHFDELAQLYTSPTILPLRIIFGDSGLELNGNIQLADLL